MAIPVLPTSAPFSPAQRSWLNGFFAGVYGLDASVTPSSTNHIPNGFAPPALGANGATPVAAPAAVAAAVADAVAPAAALDQPVPEDENEDFPWHDPGLSLHDRMKLAEGQPIKRRLMAAMAQLDCGQCGYVCETYAEAIASGAEKDLTKCVPGGRETAKKLKEIMVSA